MRIIPFPEKNISENKFTLNLNKEQAEAVASPFSHALVLAGAGSGKTRVLVHRIAYLLADQKVPPASVLAVTFTNKAASEMRGRIEKMLGSSLQNMWVGTFHGLSHRFLRLHWQEAGLLQDFQILDGEDQMRVIRRVQKSLNINEDRWPVKETMWFINGNKDEGLRSKDLSSGGSSHTETLIRIYQSYEETCQRGGLVDFAELLLRSLELWQKNPEVLSHYQKRFRHILVDEFQDTNRIQYQWVKMLASFGAYVMAVGDDDQSIYSWRGAKMENMLRFEKDFGVVKIIRLEQNYRSTGNILAAANAVIANNNLRLGKELWTNGEAGDPIKIYAGYDETEEALFIVDTIRAWRDSGEKYNDAAILYRSNAQSRILEECLIQAGMPYRIYGGLRFFEREEIKDAMGYLRLISNRHDDEAFERIVNTPTRGIGNATLQLLRDFSHEKKVSLWDAGHILVLEKKLATRASSALTDFFQLIEKLSKYSIEKELHLLVDYVIQATGLRLHFSKVRSDKGEAKLENLDELVTAAERFAKFYDKNRDENYNLPHLQAFLAHSALEAGEHQAQEFEDSVQLMTLHAAKGLEFPLVFLSGLEESLFPHQWSLREAHSLEEERRLCYVGMTRAKKRLYLTYANMRRIHGRENYHSPSRFISEIPKEFLSWVR